MIDERFSSDRMVQAYTSIAAVWENSEEILFQTSGSTGAPKQIGFTKNQVKLSAKRTADVFNLKKGASVFCALPEVYVAGKMMALRALINEWNLTWQTPSTFPVIERDYDFAVFTSQQLVQILDHDPSSLLRIKHILLGGGPISERLVELVNDLPSFIWEGYGMTETLTHIAIRNVKTDPYFMPLHGVRVEKNENENLIIEDTLLGLAKFQTNDVVEFIGEGFVVKGRTDNVIISGGVKIFPEEIERVLSAIVHRPFYIGSIQDDVLGNKLVLFVEGEEDLQLQQKIHELNLGIRKPREVFFQPIFKRTESGKIIREA